MPLDDIDRRFAQAAVKHGLIPAKELGALTAAAEGGKMLSRLVVERLGVGAEPALALLRTFHAGFPADTEDALDRHEDRLIARLALRTKALDDVAARAAVAEQDGRRAKGQAQRLGEILVEIGRMDAAMVERLY